MINNIDIFSALWRSSSKLYSLLGQNTSICMNLTGINNVSAAFGISQYCSHLLCFCCLWMLLLILHFTVWNHHIFLTKETVWIMHGEFIFSNKCISWQEEKLQKNKREERGLLARFFFFIALCQGSDLVVEVALKMPWQALNQKNATLSQHNPWIREKKSTYYCFCIL